MLKVNSHLLKVKSYRLVVISKYLVPSTIN